MAINAGGCASFAGARVAIHRLELELERVVEQLVAVLPQEREELSVSLEPPEDEFLLAADDLTRAPALDGHRWSERITNRNGLSIAPR